MQIINKLNNKKLILLYEVGMTLLTIIAVIMVSFELLMPETAYDVFVFSLIDTGIIIIFALDYFTRLILSKNKVQFFKSNMIDLISIVPFGSIFQSARIFKITRLLKYTRFLKFMKLLKLFRIIVLIAKFKKNIDKFLKTNNFIYVIWLTIFTVIIGALGFSLIENKSFSDGLWWSFVTVTTVGYGDMSPTTGVGRVLAAILMLIGIGFIGMLTGTIATFFLKNEVSNGTFKGNTIERIKRSLNDFDNLSNEDIDNIYKTLKSLK